MFKQLVVFFIFLASATFFRLTYLPKNLMLALSFGAIVLMLVTLVITMIYDRGEQFKKHFGTEIGLIFLALLLAVYGAKWGHDQSFLISAWAEYYMYFYLFYYFLHAIRFRPEELEKLMIIMAILYIGLFAFQYVMYPTMIFGARAQEARGTIRIFLPGSAFAGLMYFYFLQAIFTKNRNEYIVLCIAFLAIPFLQGTRSSIITILFGTIVYIVISKRVRSKVLVTILMLAGTVLVYFIFQDIIMSLIEVSEKQAAQEGDDIRVTSAKFYLYEFYTSNLNYLIGNGESHMMSPYGMRVWFYKSNYGFYQNDLGILGEYIKFGILYVIIVLLLLRKLFVIKIEPRYAYIKYWAVLLIISELVGGSFSSPTSIIVICSVMYIYDVSYFELKNPEEEVEEEQEEALVTQ